jgi:hypothetical protein
MRVEAANSLFSAKPIELPWKSADGGQFLDLRQDASQLALIDVAREYPPFGTLLTAINGDSSIFESTRAKVWQTQATSGADACEFHSRVELVLRYEQLRNSTEHAEDAMRRLVDLWMRESSADSVSLKIELLPCKFVLSGHSGGAIRIETIARGESPEQARMRWGLGITRVQQAILFVSRAMRKKHGIEVEV